MQHAHRILAALLVVVPVTARAQTPAAQPPVPVHVLKISAGPAGKEADGAFLLTEERTIFSRSDDREVIVLFQWEGAAGAHKLAAQWRSPDGNLGSTSSVDYVAKDRRFGVYWRLPISPVMPLGSWSIETTVDGQPAGRLSFEIKDERVVAAVVKRPLSQSELYERLSQSFVVIERIGARGRQLEGAAGLAVSGRVYTSLAAIDSAEAVYGVTADGKRLPLTDVVGLNRRQDWTVLAGVPASGEPLGVAAADGVKVGDRVFSMEGGAVGSRVLVEGTLTGQSESPSAGRRMLITLLTGPGTIGAPVVNEYGELIGIIGGVGMPGATRLIELLRARAETRALTLIPLNLIRFNPDQPGQSIATLLQKGELVAPLVGEEHVVSGGFAKAIGKAQTVQAIDQREQFSSQDKTFVTYVSWNPQVRVRGQGMIRVFDIDNRPVAESAPGKVDVRKGQFVLSSWTIPVPAPGTYRVETLLDGKPFWRGFVRITQ